MSPKHVVTKAQDAFQRGDIEALLANVAQDAVWRQSPLLPYGGEYRGHDGARDYFAKLDSYFETLAFSSHQIIEQGASVFTFGRYEAKGRRTGKIASSDWMAVWRVENGKITRSDSFIDTAALLTAL